MTRCWDYNPDARPTFTELSQDLGDWIQADPCCVDISQFNEDQPNYNESTVLVSSGSSDQDRAYEISPSFKHGTLDNPTRDDLF